MKIRVLTVAATLGTLLYVAPVWAQNSLPAPGSGSFGGGNSMPAPGTGGSFNPAPPSSWGNPWGGGPWGGPMVTGIPMSSPNWQNSGTANVVGCGYDAQGVWRVVPMLVSYNYNGIQYDVNVINAWNPWTDSWTYNVDEPAYNTDYYLNGNEYDFYTVLPIGTFYFNL